LTSNSISTDRLFNNIPAYILVLPIVNHNSCWWTRWLVFQTLAKIDTDKIALMNIAIVEIVPAALPFLFTNRKLIIKASRGNNTAVSVMWVVRVSMLYKLVSNFIVEL